MTPSEEGAAWIARTQRVRVPRLRFDRIQERLPPATVASLSFAPPALLDDIHRFGIAPEGLSAIEAWWHVVRCEEGLLKKRLARFGRMAERTSLAVIHDPDLRVRSMAFDDGGEVITFSTGFLRFFGSYCRVLACHTPWPPHLPGTPELPALAGFAAEPARFVDAQFAAITLFSNYLKLGVAIESIRPTPAQAAFAIRLWLALADFVIAHELAHLRAGHAHAGATGEQELVADRAGVQRIARDHGAVASLCALKIFFGASISIYRRLDPVACAQLEMRERHAYRWTWQLPVVGVPKSMRRLAAAYRQTSVACGNASGGPTLGRTVLETALEKAHDDSAFLDLVVRWFLIEIPEPAVEHIANLARSVLDREAQDREAPARVARLRAAYQDTAAPQELRRISLLFDALDDRTRLHVERVVANEVVPPPPSSSRS